MSGMNDLRAEEASTMISAAEAIQPATAIDSTKDVNPVERFSTAIDRLYDGTLTLGEYKAEFLRVADGEAAVKASLNAMTKDALIRKFGIMRDGKKDELVSMALDSMLERFALGKSYGSNSYFMSVGGLAAYKQRQAAALRELVAGQTDEDLATFASKVKANREERAAQREALLSSLNAPKTLDDFYSFMRFHVQGGKTHKEAMMLLTPAQRASFDELAGESTRGARKQSTDAQRTTVGVAGQKVGGEIIATKHTKKGTDLYVVRLAERVSREDYDTLNAGAKRIGGYYSSFRGPGAVPGFQFTTHTQAQAFVTLAQGDNTQAVAAAQERRDAFADDRSQTAAERLTEMADRLEERANESLSRDRKTNTARRADQAGRAEASANAEKALAKTMRNMAEAIESGTAKFLDRVRQKTQVEMFQRMVASAKDAELLARYPEYSDYQHHRSERPTGETADFAKFPSFTAFRSDLASLGRQLLQVDGTKLLAQRIMKVADDVTAAYLKFATSNPRVKVFSTVGGGAAVMPTMDAANAAIIRSGYRGKAIAFQIKRGQYGVIMSPSDAMEKGIWKGDDDKRITLAPDLGTELVEKIGRANRRGARVSVPWQLETAYERRRALARLGIETPPEMRAALREFIGLLEQPAESDKIKQLERAMVGRCNDGLDFFPTPEGTADEMVEAAGIEPGMRVLEPSAGMGHIAQRIREAGFDPDVIEMETDKRALLEAKGFSLVGRDFMDTKGREGYTYGDTFKAPDGTVGVMRGTGGLGSDRVPLVIDGDERTATYHDRSTLTPVRRNNDPKGATVPRADLLALETWPAARGDVLSSVRDALHLYDRGDFRGAALLLYGATRQAEFGPDELNAFASIVDRLLAASEGQYDRIVMNPPFSNGRDIQHVRHAFDLLKPGGRLVALMGESAFTNETKRATEFRHWLESVGGTDEKLATGTFNDPSLPVNTGANARIVVIEKPLGDAFRQGQTLTEDQTMLSSESDLGFNGQRPGSGFAGDEQEQEQQIERMRCG